MKQGRLKFIFFVCYLKNAYYYNYNDMSALNTTRKLKPRTLLQLAKQALYRYYSPKKFLLSFSAISFQKLYFLIKM